MTTEQPVAESAEPQRRQPTFLETLLVLVLAQNECLLARARVTDEEMQDAIRKGFQAVGLAMPDFLTLAPLAE